MLHKSVCVTSRTINYVYYDVIFMEKLQNYIREQGIKKKRKKEKQKTTKMQQKTAIFRVLHIFLWTWCKSETRTP